MITLYHNPRCSKSRETPDRLEARAPRPKWCATWTHRPKKQGSC